MQQNTRLVLQRGSAAAFMTAMLFVAVLVLFGVVAPRLGLRGYEDMLDGHKVLPVLRAYPPLVLTYLLGAAVSVGVLFLALALQQLLAAAAPTVAPLATRLALLHIGLTLAADLPRLLALPHLAELYGQQPDTAADSYLTVSLILSGLNVAARMLFGAWVLVVSAAAWRTQTLPAFICCLGILVSILHLGCLLLPLPPLLDAVWLIALGIVLRRRAERWP